MIALQLIFLFLGTISGVLFIIKLLKSGEYADMTESLDDSDFPLKSIYCVGFSWSERLIMLKGKSRERLISLAKLLYDPRYAEYYAGVTWAQVISFVHFFLTAALLLGGMLNSGLMFFIFLIMAVFSGYYFFNRMNELLNTRASECLSELPEIVSTMALLINAGMMLRNAWRSIAEGKEGTAYELMKRSCTDMDNGISDAEAIYRFGALTNSPEVRKFSSALAQSIERGGGELNSFLARQSVEIWTIKKQTMLQKGEAASSKLLAPIALIFVGVLIAVITGAIGMLANG